VTSNGFRDASPELTGWHDVRKPPGMRVVFTVSFDPGAISEEAAITVTSLFAKIAKVIGSVPEFTTSNTTFPASEVDADNVHPEAVRVTRTGSPPRTDASLVEQPTEASRQLAPTNLRTARAIMS
jgi:hypothetical protein